MKLSRSGTIFLVVGALLLLVSFLLDQSGTVKAHLADVAQDVALVLLTVVILEWLWDALGGEPMSKTLGGIESSLSELRQSVKLLEDGRITGLQRIYSVSGALGSQAEWMARLKSPKRNLDLMGYTLHVWTKGEHFERELLRLVNSGVRVRILIMDEDNPRLSGFINEDIAALSRAAVIEETRISKRVFGGLAKSVGDATRMEVRSVKKGLITCQFCRTDDEMTVVQYLFSVVASRSPLLVVRQAECSLFDVYQGEFEHLWEHAVPLP